MYTITFTGPKNALKGKCSHGGLNDDSRNLIAKCGINKETTVEALSPHYHLHVQAYEAAVEATKQFFIAEGYAILIIIRTSMDILKTTCNIFMFFFIT